MIMYLNKKIINVFILFLIVNINVFSLELWQGFSDDMTREDVLNRAMLLFGDNVERETGTNSASNALSGFNPDIQRAISWSLPSPNLRITIRRNRTNSEHLQNFPGLIGVSFYFYQDKLMYIRLGYGGTTEELLPIITRQFGNPTTFQYTVTNVFSSQTYPAYRWKNQGRDIFLERGSITYINQDFNSEYNNRRAEEQRRRREIEEEEERRRRETLNDIKL